MLLYLLIGIGIGASAGALAVLAWVLPKLNRLQTYVPCDTVIQEYNAVLKHIMRVAAGNMRGMNDDKSLLLQMQTIYSVCKDSVKSRERRQDIVKLYQPTSFLDSYPR